MIFNGLLLFKSGFNLSFGNHSIIDSKEIIQNYI